MERTESLFELLCDVDDMLIADAAPKLRTAKAPVWKKWLPSVACLCLAALIGLAAWQIPAMVDRTKTNEPKYPPAEDVTVVDEKDPNHAESAASPFRPRTTASLFNSFAVDNALYSCENTSKKISPKMIEDCLGTAEAKATGTSSEQTRPISYYRILGVSEQCAVAVIFEGEQDIYIYRNEKYAPTTLAQLLTDTNYEEYLTVNKATITRVEGEYLHTAVHDADTELIIEALLTPMRTLSPVYIHHGGNSTSPAIVPAQIAIEGSMEMFGYRHLDISISRNGYLVLSVFHSDYIFAISEEHLQHFLAALARFDSKPTEKTEDLPSSYNHYHSNSFGIYYSGAYRFPDITIGDIAYTCGTTLYGIDSDFVGEKLGESKAADTVIAPTISYYRLKNVAPECGIAVQFPDDPTFYSYHNFSYSPETLGDLIDGLGLDTYLRVGDPTVIYREGTVTQTAVFRDSDVAILWQTLLSDTAAACTEASDRKEPEGEIRLEIPCRLPLFCGTLDFTLWVTEDGYLHTDLFETFYDDKLYTFRLTEDRTMQYISQLLLRYPDFELTLTDPSKVPIPAGQTPETMAPNLRYNSLEIDGITYVTQQKAVDASAIGEQGGESSAIYGNTNDGMIYRTPVAYRTVAGYSSRQAVAIRFTEKEDENWYLYINPKYSGGTLRDFMETYQLKENGTLLDFRSTVLGIDTSDSTIERTGYGNDPLDIIFPSVDPDRAWEVLFGDPYAPRTEMTEYWDFIRGHYQTMKVTLLCPGLGDGEIEVILDREGYLCFVLEDYMTVEIYEIGRERASAFLAYIFTDCIENHEIRNGALLLQAGETRMDVIRRQLSKRFGMTAE